MARLWLCVFPLVWVSAQTVCDPVSFGAKHDGVTRDTASIQKAIDQCAGKGGVVRLSHGVWLSAPLTLKSKITLTLDAGARLQATDVDADYERTGAKSRRPFISANDAVDIAITGPGVIDGAGQRWWTAFRAAQKAGKKEEVTRPRLIQMNRSKHLRFENLTLQNAAMFHLVQNECEDVLISGVTIRAPADSPNTDGIDPANSRNIRIEKCDIDTGDDNIAIKAGTDGVTISDCVFGNGHGVSIGSETDKGGVHNVTVERCKFHNTRNAIRIKSYRGRGGEVSKIVYRDLEMVDVNPALIFTAYYPKIPKTDEVQPVTESTPWFHDIKVINLRATVTKNAGAIIGLPEKPFTDIVLQNVHIESAKPLEIRNATVKQLPGR